MRTDYAKIGSFVVLKPIVFNLFASP